MGDIARTLMVNFGNREGNVVELIVPVREWSKFVDAINELEQKLAAIQKSEGLMNALRVEAEAKLAAVTKERADIQSAAIRKDKELKAANARIKELEATLAIVRASWMDSITLAKGFEARIAEITQRFAPEQLRLDRAEGTVEDLRKRIAEALSIITTWEGNDNGGYDELMSIKKVLGGGQSCDTCKHGPRHNGGVVDFCDKYGMADQCYEHGFGGYEKGGQGGEQ